MPTLDQYKNAIAAAEADENEEAAAELRSRVAEAADRAKEEGNMEAYGSLAAVAEYQQADNSFMEDVQAVGQKMLNFVGTGRR